MILFFLSLAFISGYLSTRVLAQQKSSLGYIIPLGFGLNGLLYFFVIAVSNNFNVLYFLFLHVLVDLFIFVFLRMRHTKIVAAIDCDRSDFLVLFFLFLVFAQQVYGYWDAWAIWQTKAKFLASGEWTRLFSEHLKWMHPDYPLLLPSIIANGWLFTKSFSYTVPFLVSLLFSWSAYLLLKDLLIHIWNKMYVKFFALLAILTPAFLRWGSSQYADILLTVFILLAITILFREKSASAIFVAGFAFGLGVFTKNEGLLYLFLFSVSFVYASWFVNKKLSFWTVLFLGLGATPGIVSSLVVKSFAPQNEFIGSFSAIFSLLTLSRALVIVKGFVLEFLTWKEWMVFWIIVIPFFFFMRKVNKKDFLGRLLGAFLVLSLGSFFIVYILTPYDVAWHISTSLNRLLIQIFPCLVLLVAITFKNLKRESQQ